MVLRKTSSEFAATESEAICCDSASVSILPAPSFPPSSSPCTSPAVLFFFFFLPFLEAPAKDQNTHQQVNLNNGQKILLLHSQHKMLRECPNPLCICGDCLIHAQRWDGQTLGCVAKSPVVHGHYIARAHDTWHSPRLF